MRRDDHFEQKIFNAITLDWKGVKMIFPMVHPKTYRYVNVVIKADDIMKIIRAKIDKASK